MSALVLVSAEPAGANCPVGGKKLSAGSDTNANNVLDPAEVTSSAYICNGPSQPSGGSSLVAVVPEPAGTFCAYAGSKISGGVDANANGVLDASEVSSNSYACNGAPSLATNWVNVTGTSAQAVSNTGYLANNAAQVTITLPAAPALGDTVQISGVGAGGWKVAQNAGQSVLQQVAVGVGAIWTARESVRYWNSVASSADGIKLVAAERHGQLYTSTDTGASWTARESVRNWTAVASSTDGNKLVAAVGGGQLYTSTDSGLTWTPRDSIRFRRYLDGASQQP
jgi:hypothetical protein